MSLARVKLRNEREFVHNAVKVWSVFVNTFNEHEQRTRENGANFSLTFTFSLRILL